MRSDEAPRAHLDQIDRAAEEAMAVGSVDGATRRTEELARLLEISRAMNGIHDRDALLTYVGDGLRELFDAENSFVILFDAEGRPKIHSSNLDAEASADLPLSETILERVQATREPMIIDDMAEHADLKNRSSIELYKIASVLCAPLIIEDRVIGALQFDQRGESHPFPESDLRLLSLFADQVATAFHNLQLIERLGEALEEVREAQARLVQRERLSALGEMAAGIAHDFNNTLFVALGLCDVLLMGTSVEDEARGSLERIRTCALDAANTVRRLQTFARGRTGEDEEEFTVQLSAVLQEIPELTRHKWQDEAQKRGVSIQVEIDPRPTPAVRAHPAVIREVLFNLVFNAVDAMEASGSIRLSTGSEAGRVFLSVDDEGVGMDAETKKRVFEPQFTTKGASGNGFGLATCWRIAENLGGEIEVESELGRGSVFRLWLPVAQAVERTPAPESEGEGRGAHILLVDDDPAVLETTEQMVRSMGHRVTGTTNVDAALAAFRGGSFDAVLSDLGMPGLNGADLLRAIRAEDPETPVIILTGWGADGDLDESDQGLVSALLAKPITLDALQSALGSALARA